MAKFKVIKTPLTDLKAKKRLKIGDVLDRTIKEVEEFEAVNGKGYLERVEEEAPKKKK